jgi:hypothetical protein
MGEMDICEQIALDLELAQQERHKNSGCRDDFWTEKEVFIFETIKDLRVESHTFNPLNER